ncbi:hypothetical protein DRO58_07505, partial [Candidatus Bathyarchaeota archaeon]
SEHNEPIGSTLIRKELMMRGFFLSERTVRYHLQLLEAKGLVRGFGKRGRSITPEGLSELSKSLAYQRVGFIVTKFLSMHGWRTCSWGGLDGGGSSCRHVRPSLPNFCGGYEESGGVRLAFKVPSINSSCFRVLK